jgi:hypothetical protein
MQDKSGVYYFVLEVKRKIVTKKSLGFWLLAVYASFFAWLMHSFAVRSFLASFKQLVAKFLTKA